MSEPSTKKFPSIQRIRSSAEITQLRKRSLVLFSPSLMLYWQANGRDHNRLALAVNRRHGNAVKRNRIKRLIRELYRHHAATQVQGIDMLILPQKKHQDWRLSALEKDFQKLLKDISAGKGKKPKSLRKS